MADTSERLAFGIDTAEIMKMAIVHGMQQSANDSDFCRQALRLGHISGSINQQQALGTRIALESGSGRERIIDRT